MQQTRSIRRIFSCFFPRKASHVKALVPDPKQWEILPAEEKKSLAEQFLAQGEIALLNDDLSALSHFEAAATLTPENPDVWYREGRAFFDYGMNDDKEKALLVASRYFKLALQIAPDRFEILSSWGSVLLQLGIAYNEHHFYIEAKEKLQRAIECSAGIPRGTLAYLYWDYGLVWTEIAQHSGEAVDIRLSIQAFQSSMNCQDCLSPEFLNDCGNAYLQMGLLINDSRLYLQAVEYLRRAVAMNEFYADGWMSLANAYSQLYINTMDERYATLANDSYARLCQQSPHDAEGWLGWAQILGESGRQNRDSKKLCQSIEKCVASYAIDAENPLLLCQWVESLSLLGMLSNRLDLLIDAENKIMRGTDQFPDDPDLWHAYGMCMLAFGHYYSDPDYYECAIEKLQFGLSLDRTHAEIWHALALAHAEVANLTDDLDMIERSTRFFSRAMDLKPACPSLIFDAANAWMLSSELHDDCKELDVAIGLYESLLQNQKDALLNHPEWIFQYANALEWLGDFTDDDTHLIRAIDLYLHVLLLDPETPKIHFRIALSLVRLGESTGDSETFRRALSHFRFAARQDDEDEEMWLEWGIACIHLAHQSLDIAAVNQCYADAEQKLNRAGQLGNLNAYYNLACLYSIMNRPEEAMDLIRKAQKADALPSVEEIVEDEWMDNLRQTEMFAQFLSNLETKHGNGTADFY
jgi:tetratricopeptide (TPR) repeat protein